jgi:signal transduction histidine kinase
VTAAVGSTPATSEILVWAEADARRAALAAQLQMALPRGAISVADSTALAEDPLPRADAAVVDAEAVPSGAIEMLRLLRARGFPGPIVVVAIAPDDTALQSAARSLSAVSVGRVAVDKSPLALAAALGRAASGNVAISAEIAYARRVFAAGQTALSLQHSINNPLAALLAEIQLLQLEELTDEQRGSLERILELCRRVVGLVRRLDGLATAR